MTILILLNIDDRVSKIEHAQQENLELEKQTDRRTQNSSVPKHNTIQNLPEKDLDVKVLETTLKIPRIQ